MAAVTLSVINFAIAVTQAVRARRRQKKMEKEAKRRQDAAKGFMIPIEGAPSELAICYGRNKIGGVRVFHSNNHDFELVEPAEGGVAWNNDMVTFDGKKHEFLIMQQAICVGGINRVLAIDVDDRDWDHGAFRTSGTDSGEGSAGGKGGLILHTYTDGGIVDPLVVANAENRENAKFTNTAYLTGIFRLNRDDPQFSSTPQVQLYVEGLKVASIAGGAGARYMTSEKVYSNNPVLCLLDYLTNTIYGRGLPVEFIDLDTFYDAYLACEKVLVADTAKYGRLWENNDDPRDIKLYEANVTLSTSNSIRDNIETLLETMGQAELIWSAGKYKLSMFYPEVYEEGKSFDAGEIVQHVDHKDYKDLYRSLVNENTTEPTVSSPAWSRDVVAAYITDDDIDDSDDITRNWPNAQERYNYVTVRFLDESANFEENTASWPSRTNTVDGAFEDKGEWSSVGVYYKSDITTYEGTKYQLLEGQDYTNATTPDADPLWKVYDDNKVYNIFLEEDGGLPLETEFFETGITDYYHAMAKAEQRCRSSREALTYKFTVVPQYNSLEPGDIIRVNSEDLKVAGELMRIEETQVKPTGSIEISAVRFDARILAWNAPDDEVVNIPAVVDVSIAQAYNLQFTSTNTDINFTGGKLTWSPANDGRVTNYLVKYTQTPLEAIDDSTYWTTLGNTKDTSFDIPALVGNNYTVAVVSVTHDGRMAPRNDVEIGSEWPKIEIGIDTVNINDWALTTVSVYKEASSIPEKPVGGVYNFDASGLTEIPTGWLGSPPVAGSTDKVWVSHAVASALGGNGESASLTWSQPALYVDTSIIATLDPASVGVLQDENGENYGYDSAVGHVNIIAGVTNVSLSDGASYAVTSTNNCEVTINNTNGDPEKGSFAVTSLTGSVGSAVITATYNTKVMTLNLSVVGLNQGYSRDLTPPPAPSGVSLLTSYSNVFVTLEAEPDYTEGHGHKETIVYAVDGAGPFTISSASEVGRFSGTEFRLPSSLGTTSWLWFKNRSNDGVTSNEYFGGTNGLEATTGKINGIDLNDDIIEARNLVDNAITVEKVADDAITGTKIDSNSISSAHITSNAITVGKIASNAITADNLRANSVAAGKIAANAITAGSAVIANGAIENAMIASAAIDSAKIASAAITSAKIASGSITSAKIASSIQSDNYVAGVSGWRLLTTTGSLEANDIFARGNIKATDIDASAVNIVDTLHVNGGAITASYGANSSSAKTTLTISGIIPGQDFLIGGFWLPGSGSDVRQKMRVNPNNAGESILLNALMPAYSPCYFTKVFTPPTGCTSMTITVGVYNTSSDTITSGHSSYQTAIAVWSAKR